MTERITVHDPRGYPPKVVGKRLAPRLSSLDGKTVYLVDCLFDNSAVFMEQLQQWFGEHLPAVDARIIRPKETWADDPEMRSAIAAGGHAAILGIGLWSTCSPTVVGLTAALEEGGVPSVAVHTQRFHRLCKATALATGMPRLRQAYTPHPVVDQSPQHLRGYIEGNDAISGRPFMQEVLEGLTAPLEDEDVTGLSFERTTPRFVEPDTEDNLHRLFEENRWTDMLPIVLPTEARVAAMLKGTSHPPDTIVGRLRPTVFREAWEFDVEKVAVNAVMAGARPEYLPVILALASSGITARSSSTTSFATIPVINGPIRHELAMNTGIGVMGPYNHANATIGRAYGLLSQNLQGGSIPNETYMGSQGNWYALSALIPEAEERSPWQPLHVQKGYKSTDSVASVFFGGWYTHAGYGPRATWKEKMRHALAAVEQYSPPLFVMDPIVARGFVDLGFDTKEKLIAWLAENALLTAREYWDNQSIQLLRPKAVAGIEPYASRLKAAPDDVITIYEPSDIHIVVAGGETQGAWKMISGALRATVSIDTWR